MSPVATVAAWTSPALLAILADRVAAGDPDAPFLALALLVAPLIALLRTAQPRRGGAVTAAVAVASVGLLLWSSLLVLVDAASVLGLGRWPGAALGAGAALALTAWPAAERWRQTALPLGAALLVLAVIGVGVGLGRTPPAAWAAGASRPALVLGERSPWVTDGHRFPRPVTLTFAEAHRVTAAAPGVWRVVERDAGETTVREWRLAAGDALPLRAGDQLVLGAGAHARFEAGRRVPGAAVSGAEWAEPTARREPARLLAWLGALVTVVGGAAALVEPGARPTLGTALGAPLVVGTAMLVPVAWGVYTLAAAPELALGGSPAEALVRLPRLVLPGARGVVVAAAVGAALLALFLAATWALRDRLAAAAGARRTALWIALLVVAAVAALWPVDPGRVALAGLGLAASGWAAPGLAAPAARARMEEVAPATGMLAFAILAGAHGWLPAWAAPLAAYPALAAAPLASAVAALARGASGWQHPTTLGQ